MAGRIDGSGPGPARAARALQLRRDAGARLPRRRLRDRQRAGGARARPRPRLVDRLVGGDRRHRRLAGAGDRQRLAPVRRLAAGARSSPARASSGTAGWSAASRRSRRTSRSRGLPWLVVVDAIAPALAIGQAIGRIGCQLAGDGDWGTPSTLPWAMAYPRAIYGWNEPSGCASTRRRCTRACSTAASSSCSRAWRASRVAGRTAPCCSAT